MGDAARTHRKTFWAAILGAGAVALCCFTPVLVLLLAAVGASALTPYLDYVLFPALAILIVLAVVSHTRWKRMVSAGGDERVSGKDLR
ncbi:MAG: mercury resistance system transport protein MerF [Deferrisomatales bacterium]|nr:mercury resistance system transport protein MerF [Deferrisomatales bacterium]